MAIYLLLPFILIGAAASAGFGTSWLLTGMRVGQFDREQQLQFAVGLAVTVPVVAAATVLIPHSTEFQNLYGDFLHQLWLWAAAAYAIGCIFSVGSTAYRLNKRGHSMLNKHIPMTSSWSELLPETHARIGISRGRPRRQSGYRVYSALAPGDWWNKVDMREFHALYMKQLASLDPETVLSDLREIAGDRIPTLLCFERLGDATAYCHRAFVANWFKTTLRLDVAEFGAEPNCIGCLHPKFPPDLRLVAHGSD